MSEPGLGDVHVDGALTDISIGYFQSLGDTRRIATSVFPIIPSAKQSNKYHTYTKSELLRTDAQKRAPGTEAAVRTYQMSDDSFYCDVYSVAVDVSEQVKANADAGVDPEEDAARLTIDDITLRQEKDFSDAVLSTGVWGNESASTGAFSSTGLFPRIATAHKTILQNTGRRANTLVMTADGWYDGLMNNSDILDRMPDTAAKFVTEDFIAKTFMVDRVFVLDSVETSSLEGSTSDTYGFLNTQKAALLHVAKTPGLGTPSAGYTFAWSGLVGAGTEGIRTKRMEMPWKDAVPRVETDAAYDFKVTGADLGYLWSDLI